MPGMARLQPASQPSPPPITVPVPAPATVPSGALVAFSRAKSFVPCALVKSETVVRRRLRGACILLCPERANAARRRQGQEKG
jgi:hypothetical protein